MMRSPRTLWFVRFSLSAAAAEAVADGFAEDAASVSVFSLPRHDQAEIEVLYEQEPDRAAVEVRLDLLASALGFPTPSFTLDAMPKLDWLKKVASDFPPIKIARWTVHGALHRKKVPNRLYAMQIDATNVFGTGEHPTTRGCLLMLHKVLKAGVKPRRMADIGCGSGILAMGCVQSTRGEAVAVDLDPDSATIALKNVRQNGLGAKIRVGRGRGSAAPLIKEAGPYDLVMANIFADPLCEMAKDLKDNLKQGGIAILSGLLTTQAKKVIAAHRMQGLSLLEHRILGEWSVLLLKRRETATNDRN